MAQGYLAQVQKLIAERMKENPEEMKRRLKEIEEAKKKANKAPKSPPKPSIDSQLTKELIEELDKRSGLDIQKVKDLIKRGADIKAKCSDANMVLHQASWFGDMELVKECLQAGIDVNSKDDEGRSPLLLAANGSNIEITKLLISAGADVNTKDTYGRSPLHWVKSEEMKSLLKQHGATY